jgi:hypothetical protein
MHRYSSTCTITTISSACYVITCGPSRAARRTNPLNLCFASCNRQLVTLASILLSSLSMLYGV